MALFSDFIKDGQSEKRKGEQNMTQSQTLNISSWFSNFKNLKWWQGAILLAILLTGLSAIAYEGGNVNVSANVSIQIQQIENRLDIPVNSTLSAFIKSNSFIVSELDQGYCLQNGTNGSYLPPFTTNATTIIQNGLGNASANGGGSVYVSAGQNLYNASVTILNNTRLIIEAGAKNVTYTPAAGAYGIVDDFANWVFIYYSNGVPYSVFNYATGNLLTQTANMTTIYCATINQVFSGGGVQILNMVVQHGTTSPTSPVDRQLFFNDSTGNLYVYNATSSAWLPIGSSGSGGGSMPSTYPYANLTGIPVLLYANGTQGLTADWNVSGYSIFNTFWLNSTSLNTNNYYLNGATLGWIEPDSYIIDNSGGYTRAWYGANSTLAFQGTNASTIINNAIGNLTAYSYTFTGFGGGTIYLKGQFQVSNTIFSQLPISIIGVPDSTDSFAYLFANGLNGSLLYFNATGSIDWHWSIQNLHIDGVNTTGGSIGTGGPGGNYLIYINLGYGTLQNMYIMRGYGTGIFMGGQDSICDHVYSEYNGFGTGTGDGWYVATLNDQWYSCTGWNNSRYGMYIGTGQNRGLFEGCRLSWNLVGLKTLSGASQITIEGSDIFDNYNEGIYLLSADHFTIENNPSILDNGIAANNTYAGILLSSSTNCTIEGNNIYDDGSQANIMQYAVSEDGSADWNQIKDNNFAYGTNFIGVHTIGGNTTVRGNIPLIIQDRLLNVVCGQSGWTQAPTNLQAAVDGNFATFTGIGETNATAGHMGYLYYDMGANYSVTFTYLVHVWNNASNLNIQVFYGYDNATWSTLPSAYYGLSSASESTVSGGPYYIYARYLKFDFYFSGSTATKFDMRMAEVQAYDYP
jgi:parallel beta-helix repeat protein